MIDEIVAMILKVASGEDGRVRFNLLLRVLRRVYQDAINASFNYDEVIRGEKGDAR